MSTHAFECAQDVLAGAVGHVLHHEDCLLEAAATHDVQDTSNLQWVRAGVEAASRGEP